MKAISFLGTANYSVTTYVYGEQSFETALFPVALCSLFQISELLVMVTDAAQDKWYDQLAAELGDLPFPCTPTPVSIPDGHSEADLWTIFARLTENLAENDSVIFDITYSFRTLPFLTFLAASFLRVARNIQVSGIYYGAWEARQPASHSETSSERAQTDHSPVFDLTPFLRLLEMTTATDQFLKTGNASELAHLLTTDQTQENIVGIAEGLQLLRPMEVMQQSASLNALLSTSPTASGNMEPSVSLLQRIASDYSRFALSNPDDFRRHARASLERQLQIAEWYAAKQQYVHALSIAREWVLSLLCLHFGCDPMEKQNRDVMEHALARRGPSGFDWRSVPDLRRLRKLWGPPLALANLRNDVLHAGFRRNSKKPQEIMQQTRLILEELKQIAVKWGITGGSA